MAAVCRDTKADIHLVPPPSPQELIAASAGNIEKSMARTSPTVAAQFADTAQRVLDAGAAESSTPTQILALAMATMSGYTELPAERSILGQAEGSVTLGITTPGAKGFPSAGALLGSLRRITNDKVAGAIGKVELFDDPDDAGVEAAFDIPRNFAEEIMAAARENGALHRAQASAASVSWL
jgi:GUCT (NUC152) domain